MVGQSCLENFYSTNLELASQPTPTLVCLALYLFCRNKYIELGTIYDFETFTCIVLIHFYCLIQDFKIPLFTMKSTVFLVMPLL